MRWLLLAALGWLTGCGATLQASGFAAADGRLFVQAPRYVGQELGTGVSLVAEPQLTLTSESERHKLTLRPFYRLDPNDDRRSHGDVREAGYRLSLEHFEAGVGAGVFTWGVLESHRPGDVVNQLDFVEAIDGTAKLGQPYVELGWVGEVAALKAYCFPYFRERTFPGVRGRLRFGSLIDVDHPQYETALGPWQPSGAVRLTVNAGGFDLGFSAFTGVSRDPRFILELTRGEVIPEYDLSHQLSADAQATYDALTLKVEGFFRLWSARLVPFWGGGVGADYTFFQLGGSEADLSLAAEFLYDSRPLDAPVTFFDHDAFAGLRLALNDVASTLFTAGAVVDVLSGATFVKVEASRRFGEHWRLTLDLNLFLGQPGTLQGSFVQDNHGAARLAYYF